MKHTAIALLAVFALLAPALPAADKPNILYIVADDLGWKDVGFHGVADIKTPNLDKLAADGARLEQFYVQPLWVPGVAPLLRGMYETETLDPFRSFSTGHKPAEAGLKK